MAYLFANLTIQLSESWEPTLCELSLYEIENLKGTWPGRVPGGLYYEQLIHVCALVDEACGEGRLSHSPPVAPSRLIETHGGRNPKINELLTVSELYIGV